MAGGSSPDTSSAHGWLKSAVRAHRRVAEAHPTDRPRPPAQGWRSLSRGGAATIVRPPLTCADADGTPQLCYARGRGSPEVPAQLEAKPGLAPNLPKINPTPQGLAALQEALTRVFIRRRLRGLNAVEIFPPPVSGVGSSFPRLLSHKTHRTRRGAAVRWVLSGTHFGKQPYRAS